MSTQSQSKHSALPWAIGGRSANDNTIAIFEGGINNPAKRIALALVTPQPFYRAGAQEANAAHIVRCVNSHEALTEALEQIISRLSNAATDGDEKQDALQIAQDALDSAKE